MTGVDIPSALRKSVSASSAAVKVCAGERAASGVSGVSFMSCSAFWMLPCPGQNRPSSLAPASCRALIIAKVISGGAGWFCGKVAAQGQRERQGGTLRLRASRGRHISRSFCQNVRVSGGSSRIFGSAPLASRRRTSSGLSAVTAAFRAWLRACAAMPA